MPYLLDVDLPRGYYSAGQRLLADWDFHQDADSAAAAYYNVVWRNLLDLTFHDELPGDLRPDGGQRWMAVVADLLRGPRQRVVGRPGDRGRVETRDDILAAGDARGPRRPHPAAVAEPRRVDVGRAAPAGAALERRSASPGIARGRAAVQPRRLGGRRRWCDRQRDVVGRRARGTTWSPAPSMRMVVSLADLDDSRWINLTGVSGHAFNDHYTDQTDLWVGRRDAALGVHRGRRRGRSGGHAHPGAGRGGVLTLRCRGGGADGRHLRAR